jgi:hypothetical protein
MYSRFRRTPETVYDGQETIDVWEPPEFLTTNLPPSYISTFTVTSNFEGRPDLISSLIYNSPYYDWVLLVFNNVTNTLNWPPSGITIKYPHASVVITGVSG